MGVRDNHTKFVWFVVCPVDSDACVHIVEGLGTLPFSFGMMGAQLTKTPGQTYMRWT